MNRIAFAFLLLLPAAFGQQQWSMGYYTPYGSPGSPVSNLDMGGLTHVIHWAALVQANGTLDLNYQQISADGPALISKAHGTGVKVILGIVNPYWIGQSGNLPSAAANYRSTLVSNVMNVVNTYGYDGVDIDWEPLNSSADGGNFKTLAADLKAQLGSRPLTTATVVTDYSFWGSAHGSFDRINMMTYDMCGTWDSYSWYNSALYDQDGMVWSINLAATRYKNAGVPAYKLGIGIPFYGYQWTGNSGPRQPIGGASLSQINYQSLVSMIANPQWDSQAKVPYKPGSNSWISFDNDQSITEKINYVKANGLGGWIIWNLSSDYIPTANPQHPLLNAVKNAMGTTTTSAAPSVTTSSLAAATAGIPYSQTLTASGSVPITWSVTGGSLPVALSLNSSTGAISGTPTTSGTSTFTVQATNSAGYNTKQLSITVNAASPAVTTAPSITIASPLASCTTGSAYSQTLAASGTAPFSWSLTAGALPTGLTLDPATGVISGTPLAQGTFTFTVQAANGAGANSKQFSLTVAAPPVALRFVPVTPCRVVDTRNPAGPFGGPALNNNSRDFSIPNGVCGIPVTAAAYSLNVTVVPSGSLGYVTIWPTGLQRPTVSTLNSLDGRIKADAAIVPAGTNGSVSVFATNATDLILDINGYFVAATDPAGLAYYPITPCRLADTRGATGALGGPALVGGQRRDFPLAGSCGIPSTARAYALNFTVVPSGPVGFLATWPAGSPQPLVSTLNAPTGGVIANASIVPAGTNGAVSVYTTQSTQLVIDVNGYFAPPAANGLSFYAVNPCRVVDTRLAMGPLGGPSITGQRSLPLSTGSCGLPSIAQAFSLNATVVPPVSLGYLTLWQAGLGMPVVSTLNALDGSLVSNAATVPTSNGSINAYTTSGTDLILDVNGYFAP